MFIRIASIPIEIDDKLLCEKTVHVLKSFSSEKTLQTDALDFRIVLSKSNTFIADCYPTTRLNTFLYQETAVSIIVYAAHSNFKIDIKNRCMEIYPTTDHYLTELDFITDLKLLFSLLILEYGGILLHSSAVYKEQTAFVFTGESGAGKSTISMLLNESWSILNDDFNVLLPLNEHVLIYSTPFGKISSDATLSPKVKSIFLIRKSIINKINQINGQFALFNLLKNTCSFPSTDYFANKLFDNILRIKELVFIGELLFSKNRSINDLFKDSEF